jgi:hypothetical protein
MHTMRRLRLPALIAVLPLLGAAAPVAQWHDATGQSRSRAQQEQDSTACLMQIIITHQQHPDHAPPMASDASNQEFMDCMAAKGWAATLQK